MAVNRFTAEENIQQAKELLATGFTTKAAQKNALEKVSNAFDRISDRLSTFLLSKDARGNAEYEGAYWDKPSYVHQFKDAKHGAWYAWVGKREMANELLALRNEIKASPIVKQSSKAERAQQAVNAVSGGELIAAAVAPLKEAAIDLAENEARQIIARVTEELKLNGMDMQKVAPYPSSRVMSDFDYQRGVTKYKLYNSLVKVVSSRSHLDPVIVEMSDMMIERFMKHTKEDAAAQYESYVIKLITKIGDVTKAKLSGEYIWDYSFLTVTKPDGNIETWKTQMILNVSKLGKLFNQFPTRKMK